MPGAIAAEAPVEVAPAPAAIDAPSKGAVAPAAKKARQYDLSAQQPLQPLPQLQPPLHPPALPASPTTSSPTEPDAKKQKPHDEDEDKDMDLFHPLQPHDPSLLPIAEQQGPAALDLEASRSRSRTHSEVSETLTIAFPEPNYDPPRQIGQEEPSVPPELSAAPAAASRSSSVVPIEFCSDIVDAHRRVQSQLGTLRSFSSGIQWGSIILCFGLTTLKRPLPTTHLT